MTVEDILQTLSLERTFGSRFPVRIIFINDLAQYRKLIGLLQNACDVCWNIADFCAGSDVYPNFEKMQIKIGNVPDDKHILLLSVGEYLRLSEKRELSGQHIGFPALWTKQQNENSKKRIIVPLFACREVFEHILPQVGEREEPYLWEIPAPNTNKNYSVTVYSEEFAKFLPDAVHGIRDWLLQWEQAFERKDCACITQLHYNVQKAHGLINLNTIAHPFDYICDSIADSKQLKQEWGTTAQWASILPYVEDGESFSEIIEAVLNIKSFEPISMLAKWKIASPQEKWILWLWYRVNDANDYCTYAIRHAERYENIPAAIRDAIISVPAETRATWLPQRMSAMQALGFSSFSKTYFSKIDTSIKQIEDKLSLLTYQTHEERSYAIRIVGEWLRQGVDYHEAVKTIEAGFPLLAYYMKECKDYPPVVSEYFQSYKRYKLSNTLPDDTVPAPYLDMNDFSPRYPLLSEYDSQDCRALWIDGMGVEWMSLLMACLRKYSHDVIITPNVACARLPSETEYNAQWESNTYSAEKWNRLDVLSHKGMPDEKGYYACIDQQLTAVCEAAKRACELLDDHEFVIVTADHGSSRLGARFFHDKNTAAITPPAEAVVRSFGRFCELKKAPIMTDLIPVVERVKTNGREYLVMKTYDHYVQSGNAAGTDTDEYAVVGESHGGKTPEEVLVPIVVLQHKTAQKIGYYLKESILHRINNTVTAELCFSKPVSTLMVMAASQSAVCEMVSDTEWLATFQNVSGKQLVLEVYANGKQLQKKETISIETQGIQINDDLFGGL